MLMQEWTRRFPVAMVLRRKLPVPGRRGKFAYRIPVRREDLPRGQPAHSRPAIARLT